MKLVYQDASIIVDREHTLVTLDVLNREGERKLRFAVRAGEARVLAKALEEAAKAAAARR